MTSTIKKVTKNYNMRIPIFDAPGWGREISRNIDIIDASLYLLSGITGIKGVWSNGTNYTVGTMVIDDTDNLVFRCLVTHTTPATGTFTDDRINNPSYWEQVPSSFVNAGEWASGVVYSINQFLYTQNKWGIVRNNYQSSSSFDDDVSAGHIAVLLDITQQFADQTEGEAGIADDVIMSPIRVAQYVAAQVGNTLASKVQGSKADTALQPININDSIQAHDDFLDALAGMTPGSAGQVIAFDGSGDPVPTWAGDMLKSTYDPDANEANAFDLSNQYGDKPTEFATVADLLANASLGYSAARRADQVASGDIVNAQGFRYEVAASGATDHHVETAGGVKLYVLGPVISPQALGAAADGSLNGSGTDDSDFIQKANDIARENGWRCEAVGKFRIDKKVVINSHFNGASASFYATGDATTDVAVEISTGSGDVPSDIPSLTRETEIILPDVINTAKVSTGWDGFGTGVRYVNVQNAKITERTVQNFGIGFELVGNTQGCSYNTILAGYARNNKINRRLRQHSSTGWVNKNDFIGGRHFISTDEGTRVPGTRHILIDTTLSGSVFPINSNVFYGGSVEGSAPEYALDCGGCYNDFRNMHWERSGGAFVYFRNNGFSVDGVGNVIDGGYQSWAINVTQDTGAARNRILASVSTSRIEGSGAAITAMNNRTSDSNAHLVGFSAGVDVMTANPATEYNYHIGANKFAMKLPADAYDRVRITNGGRIYIGNGTEEPTAGMEALGTKSCRLHGNWYFQYIATPPTPVAGLVPLWFDSATGTMKFRLPDGTIKTVTTS